MLARELTDDTNETYLLAHKALRSLLRSDQPIGEANLADLRLALSRAVEAIHNSEQSSVSALPGQAIFVGSTPRAVKRRPVNAGTANAAKPRRAHTMFMRALPSPGCFADIRSKRRHHRARTQREASQGDPRLCLPPAPPPAFRHGNSATACEMEAPPGRCFRQQPQLHGRCCSVLARSRGRVQRHAFYHFQHAKRNRRGSQQASASTFAKAHPLYDSTKAIWTPSAPPCVSARRSGARTPRRRARLARRRRHQALAPRPEPA